MSTRSNRASVWPEAVAPWRVGLVTMRADDGPTNETADGLYDQLTTAGPHFRRLYGLQADAR